MYKEITCLTLVVVVLVACCDSAPTRQRRETVLAKLVKRDTRALELESNPSSQESDDSNLMEITVDLKKLSRRRRSSAWMIVTTFGLCKRGHKGCVKRFKDGKEVVRVKEGDI